MFKISKKNFKVLSILFATLNCNAMHDSLFPSASLTASIPSSLGGVHVFSLLSPYSALYPFNLFPPIKCYAASGDRKNHLLLGLVKQEPDFGFGVFAAFSKQQRDPAQLGAIFASQFKLSAQYGICINNSFFFTRGAFKASATLCKQYNILGLPMRLEFAIEYTAPEYTKSINSTQIRCFPAFRVLFGESFSFAIGNHNLI